MKRTASLQTLTTIVALAALLLAPRGITQVLTAEKEFFDPGDWLLLKLFEAVSKAANAGELNSTLMVKQVEPSPAPLAMQAEDYGADLWLEVGRPTGESLPVKVHNTIPGKKYPLWGTERLSGTDAWNIEQTFTGASGQDFTDLTVALMGRSSLFLIVPLAFEGIGDSDTGIAPPDSMGAIGPTHFVEIVNGRIAVFDRTTGELVPGQAMSLNDFFGGENMIDPRLAYDHESDAWIACALDLQASSFILAVKKAENPTPLSAWTPHVISVSIPGFSPDFGTLGFDKNGIYMTTIQRPGGQPIIGGQTIVAVKKPQIYDGILHSTPFNIDMAPGDLKVWTIQPAVNFDDSPLNGHAWLVAKGPPSHGTPYRGGAVHYRRLLWNGTVAQLVDQQWIALGDTSYRNYFDLDDETVGAPQLGDPPEGLKIDLNGTGSRLMNAVIRNGHLWSCQHIGVNDPAGIYTGDASGSPETRSAIQWLRLQIQANGTLSFVSHGRVFDDVPATLNPMWYYFPSVMVNQNGDMVMGFSGSSAQSYIGAFYTWRLANGATPEKPGMIQAGQAYYGGGRFGDYSATTLDPLDNLTFWTVQEFAKDANLVPPDTWGTWIAKLRVSY